MYCVNCGEFNTNATSCVKQDHILLTVMSLKEWFSTSKRDEENKFKPYAWLPNMGMMEIISVTPDYVVNFREAHGGVQLNPDYTIHVEVLR